MLEILSNPIILGTLTVLGAGSTMFFIKDVPKQAFKWLSRRIVYTMEITNESPIYEWVRAWVGEQTKKARFVEGRIVPPEPGEAIPYGGARTSKFFLAPRGFCLIRYRGHRVATWVWRENLQFSNNYRETFTFQTVFGGRKLFEQLLIDAHAYASNKNSDTVEVWTPDGREWRLADRKIARPASSLCLTDDVSEIFDDVKKFLAERKWYAELGIPYRRGYLLHGPPGNGKSSVAHAMASELKVGINVVNLSSFGSDQALVDCLGNVPAGNILLLEDIDAAWSGREATKGNGLSFSGLLNALDGVVAKDGQIVVMTTNHLNKLDPALVRPGRADVQLKIDNATKEQASAMFQRFFPDTPLSAANLFEMEGQSMAKIQEHLLKHRNDVAGALGSSEVVEAA